MAEQQHPVRRKVALKVLKPGMDTRQVIARFEAERQALALMDHPHIAKVLDAGATDTGRPFFVMELVKGVPITEYCDAHQHPLKIMVHGQPAPAGLASGPAWRLRSASTFCCRSWQLGSESLFRFCEPPGWARWA